MTSGEPWWMHSPELEAIRAATLAELERAIDEREPGCRDGPDPVLNDLWIVDEVKRSPAGKPDYRWAKAETEARPADEVQAKHVGAQA